MLLVVLLVLAILTERGSIALTATITDLTQTSTERTSKQAFSTAEAGIEEAKGRLIGKPASNPNFIADPAAAPNPLWSAYILTSGSWTTAQDPDYNAAYTNYFPTTASQTNTTKVVNGLQTAIPYWIKIRHKREYDAELEGHTPATPHYVDGDTSTQGNHTAANPGNIIYYGYHPASPATATEFTTATATSYQPVELVRAYGTGPGKSKGIEVELVHSIDKVGAPIQAPMYARGDTHFYNSTTSVSGNDNCGASTKPPMFVKTPAEVFGSPLYLGSPATPQYGALDLNISSLINSLRAGATVVTTDQSDSVFGSSNNYVTVYSDTSNPVNVNGLHFDDGTGYGALLVEGDVKLEDLDWYGLILVTGHLSYQGESGNPVRIRGAVIANQISDLTGNVDIRYDSCQVAKALADQPLQVKKWKERS
ncbi:MAG: hypothetical protein AUG11_02445 [Nitrospirae bacterium 13_1_20CM_2_62_14]|nr:MAG: hypothetical protein AUG11_02445 [Nitrospirae bacterium 13_1_20CM_2_62_14]